MGNLNFYSLLLLIVCCVVSMIEAHSIPLAESSSSMISEREAKNLLLFPFQPIQSHSFGPQSRFGFGSRQTNSPISPAIAQNGLGPFFGIFPNLLTQPCPDCPACTTEAPPTTTTHAIPVATTQAPVVCPPPPAPAEQTITDCSLPGGKSTYVAAFNGTIKLNAPKNVIDDPKRCAYKIVAAHPYTKLNMTCTTKPDKINLVITSDFVDSAGAVGPLLTVGSLGAQGEVYTSISNYFDIVLNNSPDPEQNVIAECTFQSLA